MRDKLTKDDVLGRDELDMELVLSKPMEKYTNSFKQEGEHPDNQYWHGGVCYVPVTYRAQPFKLRVVIRARDYRGDD